jgi:DNA recombination protein RmuC
VDSKVPIAGYLSATERKTDQERDDALAAHLRQVREHVRALGSKEYWRQFPTSPEFVVDVPAAGAVAVGRAGTGADAAGSGRRVCA